MLCFLFFEERPEEQLNNSEIEDAFYILLQQNVTSHKELIYSWDMKVSRNTRAFQRQKLRSCFAQDGFGPFKGPPIVVGPSAVCHERLCQWQLS